MLSSLTPSNGLAAAGRTLRWRCAPRMWCRSGATPKSTLSRWPRTRRVSTCRRHGQSGAGERARLVAAHQVAAASSAAALNQVQQAAAAAMTAGPGGGRGPGAGAGGGGGGGGGGSGGGGGGSAGPGGARAGAYAPGPYPFAVPGVAAGGGGTPGPNFGAIYKLFAGLFDPQRPFDAGAAVEGVGVLSALDKEIVKLLVKNLEVNLGNVGVCRRLLQNYMASVNAPVGR
ncbi:hypothetical protein I4F81_010837 [Pyropia yezoensis]|uniref:Uncharacterized protein n=1 Tax=Pyropia yezoensis TaxID=2788 RepID=A0ACC3CER7_PYRYE|nr:hypothetical protein I4F81_010837 [Neopyropia yezoensis]